MADILKNLFKEYTGRDAESVVELPSSGSHRRYFRLSGGDISLIGVIGTCREENNAFIVEAKHFAEQGICATFRKTSEASCFMMR